jgi:hypothetical protein
MRTFHDLEASEAKNCVYWEAQQYGRFCALHCVNAILQGPYFSEVIQN